MSNIATKRRKPRHNYEMSAIVKANDELSSKDLESEDDEQINYYVAPGEARSKNVTFCEAHCTRGLQKGLESPAPDCVSTVPNISTLGRILGIPKLTNSYWGCRPTRGGQIVCGRGGRSGWRRVDTEAKPAELLPQVLYFLMAVVGTSLVSLPQCPPNRAVAIVVASLRPFVLESHMQTALLKYQRHTLLLPSRPK